MSIHELQAALRALDEAADGHTANAAEVYATARVIEAARRVAEGAGEPVAWRLQGGPWSDDVMWFNASVPICEALLKVDGVRVEYAYSGLTTPPSADALVEALEKLSAELRKGEPAVFMSAEDRAYDRASDNCADLIDALIAKHKENTDGR